MFGEPHMCEETGRRLVFSEVFSSNCTPKSVLVDVQVITFKAPSRLVSALDVLARRLGTTRSDIIRKAIYSYLKEHNIHIEEGWF